jgi:hypothetical protein
VAEIIGVGITHQPPLGTEPAKPFSLTRILKDPGLPERLRSPEGWPAQMRAEWAEDEGEAHGRAHRDAIAAELQRARATIDSFNPDLMVVWGDDQYENFIDDVVPAFCVMGYDAVEFSPWKQWPGPNHWGEPEDKIFTLHGHRRAAKYLATSLLENDFDIAYAYRPLHTTVGHAFRNTILYLDWERRGFDYPIVPISVNCYGRRVILQKGYLANQGSPPDADDFDPPSPSPARCFALGAAVARALLASPWRVALVASSSWSHAFLTEKNHFLFPDHAADMKLYEALLAGDYDVWRTRSLREVEESGQHELLNWFCLVGALSELKLRPDSSKMFQSSIMNSNKVIATFSRM